MINRLKSIFSAWRVTLKTEEDEKQYAVEFIKALAQFRVDTPEKFNRGLARARKEAHEGERFLPSGSTFAGWCKPTAEDYGIDSFEKSYIRIQSRAWHLLHPAFLHVATQTMSVDVVVRQFKNGAGRSLEPVTKKQQRILYDLKTLTSGDEYASRRVAREIYDEVVKRVKSGEEFERVDLVEGTVKPNYIEPEIKLDMNGPRGNEAMQSLLASMGSMKAHA